MHLNASFNSGSYETRDSGSVLVIIYLKRLKHRTLLFTSPGRSYLLYGRQK